MKFEITTEKQMEKKTTIIGVRLLTPAHIRRYTAKLVNYVRRDEVTESSALVQIQALKLLLDAIRMQSANQNEIAEMDEA
jgi:hypothetical protein